MKKVALITTNKILAESFDTAKKSIGNLNFELFLLLNSKQALLDVEILEIDIALIDMALIDLVENGQKGKNNNLSFCEKLHRILPKCHLLLLVSQDDLEKRKMAIEAKEKKIIEDYVFYDASLKYLFAKLTAF